MVKPNINKEDIKNIVEAVEDEKEKKLWKTIIDKLINIDLNMSFQKALDSEVKFIRGEVEEPFSPYILKVKMKELRDYGSADDIASPLGFLRVTLPFKQNDPDYLNIYAPCALSTLELLRRYGPEVTALYSANINPDKEIDELYNAASERYKKISNPNLWIKLRDIIYRVKHKLAAFYSVSTSQHFYQLGIYFYQDQFTKYVGSRSPGIMLPHEYYGEDIYYPGISENISPLSIGNQGAGFRNYRKLLNGKISKKQKVENPVRPFYFDEGIANGKSLVKYVVFENNARSAFKEYIKSIKDKDNKDKYINDAVELLFGWFQKPIEIFLFNQSSNNYVLNKYTLLSSSYIYISERDQKRKKISRGRVFNINLIKQLLGIGAASLTLVTMLNEVLEFMLGTIGSMAASKLIEERVDEKIREIGEDLENTTNLRVMLLNQGGITKGKIRKWLEEWIQ